MIRSGAPPLRGLVDACRRWDIRLTRHVLHVSVQAFSRFIYIHGVGDEPTLGRPASHGCIHLAAADLLPLFDAMPAGTLVWITDGPW